MYNFVSTSLLQLWNRLYSSPINFLALLFTWVMCSDHDRFDVNTTPRYFTELTCFSGLPALINSGGGVTEREHLREMNKTLHLSVLNFRHSFSSTRIAIFVISDCSIAKSAGERMQR